MKIMILLKTHIYNIYAEMKHLKKTLLLYSHQINVLHYYTE